jgi:hypothetical protein
MLPLFPSISHCLLSNGKLVCLLCDHHCTMVYSKYTQVDHACTHVHPSAHATHKTGTHSSILHQQMAKLIPEGCSNW